MTVDLGAVVYSAVKPIIKIYFIIGAGFWLAKRNILSVATCRDISDTIVTLILPCLIFQNIVSNLQSNDIKNLGIVFFTAVLLFAFGFLLCLANYFITKSPKRWMGGLLSVGFFPNISDLPIAYIQTLANGGKVFTKEEGAKGVAYVCIFLAAQATFQFSLGLYRLVEWDFRPELLDDEKNAHTSSETNSESKNSHASVSSDDIPGVETSKNEHENSAAENDRLSAHSSTHESSSQPVALERRIDTNRPQVPDDDSSLRDDRSISSSLTTPTVQPPEELENSSSTTTTRVRRRRGSLVTDALALTVTRSRDLRHMRSQDVGDVIYEYSEYDSIRDNTGIARALSGGSDVAGTALRASDSRTSRVKRPFTEKLKARLLMMGKNVLTPTSMSLIVSIAIAMAPPLKALFVKSAFHLPDAPDGEPPLSFVMDITSYIGAASVPLGLILLGATIARLEVKSMPEGFWKTAVGITLSRLIILPIIGVGITTGFYKSGWYGDDKLLRFISVLEFGLPSATSLVYFTAFYTDPSATDHLQMDCLAVALIFQYSILCISLPFLVSFTLKVSLGY